MTPLTMPEKSNWLKRKVLGSIFTTHRQVRKHVLLSARVQIALQGWLCLCSFVSTYVPGLQTHHLHPMTLFLLCVFLILQPHNDQQPVVQKEGFQHIFWAVLAFSLHLLWALQKSQLHLSMPKLSSLDTVVVWIRTVLIGSHIWMLSNQRMASIERTKRIRRYDFVGGSISL